MSPRGRILGLVCGGLLWASPLLAATAPAAVPLATEDIHDIRGPVPIPVWWRWLALAGGAGLTVGLTVITIAAVRRRRARPLDPHERALKRLAEAHTLAESGQAREYAAAASDAVRQYIEERFSMLAAHLTTEEFFEHLLGHENTLPGEHRAYLVQFLGACDLAKFARFPLPREGMAELNEKARQFVVATARPQPKTQPATSRTS